MHRYRANEIPGPRARNQYRAFVLALDCARKDARDCSELMQCWLDLAGPFLDDRADESSGRLDWWRAELVQEFRRLRRTRQAGALASAWTSAQMDTEFRYRGFGYAVEFDFLAGARAWQGRMILPSQLDGRDLRKRIELTAGTRQQIPGLVFLSLVEEGRRKIDETEFGLLSPG